MRKGKKNGADGKLTKTLLQLHVNGETKEDGQPVLSCLMLGVEAVNTEIVTVEGMSQNGRPHTLQKTFADLGAAQCGYCIPGILLTAKALLDKNPHPSRDEIRQALSGNLCRCTGYTKILQAVELAAKECAG